MDIAIGLANIILIGSLAVGTLLFLRRAVPLRRERPELLRNGLWFLLPFLLMPLTFLFGLILLPVSLVVVLVALVAGVLRRGPVSLIRGPLFWASLGELASGVVMFGCLDILNTYFVH
jgi:hypothetical protein